MSIIPINGIEMYIKKQGEGLPLIFIHGNGMDHTLWNINNTYDNISKKYMAIAYDCRGHGLSGKPASYTLNDHISDTLAIMEYYNLDKIYLYGASMGSYIAQGVAIAQPERITKLILVVPKSEGLTSSMVRIMNKHAEEISKLDYKQKEIFLGKFIVHNPEILAGNPSLLKSKLTPEQLKAANKALEGFNFRNDLHKISAKTLIISGKFDGLNPPFEGKICADGIKNSKFIEMQYSGHFPVIEEPELYNSIVNDFLNEPV